MTTKLIQKHLFKGTQTFEIIDDVLKIHIKTPFKEESLSVMLTVLNPEPVISRSRLDFVSRVNGESLVSLYLAKPNAQEFNAFVNTLKQRALEEYNAFTGIIPSKQPQGLAGNVYDEPPAFDDPDPNHLKNTTKTIDAARIDEAIQMLGRYIESEDIRPLIAALEDLKKDPQHEANLVQLANAFNDLGSTQGAVLTYAPYIAILLADDPVW